MRTETSTVEVIKVSVVMCTFNGALFIEEQLASILQQTYPLYELLIFDDCSTDNTVTLVRQLIEAAPMAKLIVNTTNVGFERNFEQAIRKASGEVIAIADQDDIWMPRKIETLLNEWNPACPLIYSNSVMFSGAPPANPATAKNFAHFYGTDGRKLFLRNTVSGHSLMVRKSFLDTLFPYTEHIYYDWLLAVTAAYNGGVQFVPDILVLYRIHANNVSIKESMQFSAARKAANERNILNTIHAFSLIPNMPEAHRAVATRFIALLKARTDAPSWPLFFFLLEHRKQFFASKKKKFGFISHIKHSFRLSHAGEF